MGIEADSVHIDSRLIEILEGIALPAVWDKQCAALRKWAGSILPQSELFFHLAIANNQQAPRLKWFPK